MRLKGSGRPGPSQEMKSSSSTRLGPADRLARPEPPFRTSSHTADELAPWSSRYIPPPTDSQCGCSVRGGCGRRPSASGRKPRVAAMFRLQTSDRSAHMPAFTCHTAQADLAKPPSTEPHCGHGGGPVPDGPSTNEPQWPGLRQQFIDPVMTTIHGQANEQKVLRTCRSAPSPSWNQPPAPHWRRGARTS